MKTEHALREETERLTQLHRSGGLPSLERARVTAALDTLRWALGERAILSPCDLAAIEAQKAKG